jgi:hypothetical protein
MEKKAPSLDRGRSVFIPRCARKKREKNGRQMGLRGRPISARSRRSRPRHQRPVAVVGKPSSFKRPSPAALILMRRLSTIFPPAIMRSVSVLAKRSRISAAKASHRRRDRDGYGRACSIEARHQCRAIQASCAQSAQKGCPWRRAISCPAPQKEDPNQTMTLALLRRVLPVLIFLPLFLKFL